MAQSETPELFYHYRRHKLSRDTDNSLLLYICSRQDCRQVSFGIVNQFEQRISDGREPKAYERAERITRGIVAPYLQRLCGNSDRRRNQTMVLELVDIGAGSGSLAAHLCRHASRLIRRYHLLPAIRAWLVDLSLSRPSRSDTWSIDSDRMSTSFDMASA